MGIKWSPGEAMWNKVSYIVSINWSNLSASSTVVQIVVLGQKNDKKYTNSI